MTVWLDLRPTTGKPRRQVVGRFCNFTAKNLSRDPEASASKYDDDETGVVK